MSRLDKNFKPDSLNCDDKIKEVREQIEQQLSLVEASAGRQSCGGCREAFLEELDLAVKEAISELANQSSQTQALNIKKITDLLF